MPKFSTHVALMDPTYQPANFAPGDEVPDWAVNQVGAHVLETEGNSEPAEAPDLQAQDDAGGGTDGDGDGEDETVADDEEQPDFTAPAPARRGRARKQ